MINITISGGVRVTGLPPNIRDQIKRDLTFRNKAYDDASKYGRYIPANLKPFHEFYFTDKASGEVFFPKGYIKYFLNMVRHNNLEYKIADQTFFLPKDQLLDLTFNGTLRPYQEDAVKDILSYPNGLLEAKTGAGKTAMGIYIIAKRRQSTLIVVHSKELLNQWKARIKQFLGVNAGTIGDGKFDIRPITVAIVNSVKKYIDKIQRKFGFVIIDETHRVPSTIFTDALLFLHARYTLGLSATPFRNDGLDRAINVFVGPTLHVVPPDVLHDMGAVLKPEIHFVATKFYSPRSDYKDIIKELSHNKERNTLVAKVAIADVQLQNEAILIAVDRVAMGTEIAKILKEFGYDYRLLHGSIPSDERKRIVRDVREGRVKILIATIALIGEGFDLDKLNSLLLASPVKYAGRVIQTAGRILRPAAGKTARIYDFRDDSIRILRNHAILRTKIYASQGW